MKRKKRTVKEFLDQVWQTPPPHEVEEVRAEVWKRLEAELDKHDLSLRSLYGDGWSAAATNQLELQVLTAASALRDRAEFNSVTDMVESWTGCTMIANVYGALCQLEKRGLINVRRRKQYGSGQAVTVIRYEVTEDGDRALRRAKAEGKQLMHAQADPVNGEIVS